MEFRFFSLSRTKNFSSKICISLVLREDRHQSSLLAGNSHFFFSLTNYFMKSKQLCNEQFLSFQLYCSKFYSENSSLVSWLSVPFLSLWLFIFVPPKWWMTNTIVTKLCFKHENALRSWYGWKKENGWEKRFQTKKRETKKVKNVK